jgi:hypothetical protein
MATCTPNHPTAPVSINHLVSQYPADPQSAPHGEHGRYGERTAWLAQPRRKKAVECGIAR